MYTAALDNFFDNLPSVGPKRGYCIVTKGGEEIYRQSVGGMKDDSLCFIFSCTKPITCTAALQLHERGLFDMLDPVSKFLPEFEKMSIMTENGIVPAKNEITMNDLFTMRAGLSYDRETEDIKAVKKATDGKSPTREVMKAVAKQPLLFEPGTHWNYSMCHDVLGAVVEVISGMTLGEYLRENIFVPCGMYDTGFKVMDSDRLEPFYINDRKTIVAGDAQEEFQKLEFRIGSEYESGGAGLVSCAKDYIKFATAMANGGVTESGARILSPASIDLMRTNHMTAEQMKDIDWIQLKGYGYGLGVRTMVDRALGGALSPVGEFGWSGYAGSYVLLDAENNIALFYIQQMVESEERYISIRLRNILYGSL